MKDELENKLIEKYPEFFEYLKDYEGPLMPISFGFEFSNGWYTIVDSLMGEIHNVIFNSKENPDEWIKSVFWRWVCQRIDNWLRYRNYKWRGVRAYFNKFKNILRKEKSLPLKVDLIQAKEKFGGLRFYISVSGGRKGDVDKVYGMIDLAESLSYKTCELCGSTKNVGMTKGWVVVCCKECFDSGKTNIKKWEENVD